MRYGLPILAPVDERRPLHRRGAALRGPEADRRATKPSSTTWSGRGRLLAAAEVEHQYPHCWRCRNPVLFRATEQWFASIDGFREEALQAIDEVQWIPRWGRGAHRQHGGRARRLVHFPAAGVGRAHPGLLLHGTAASTSSTTKPSPRWRRCSRGARLRRLVQHGCRPTFCPPASACPALRRHRVPTKKRT